MMIRLFGDDASAAGSPPPPPLPQETAPSEGMEEQTYFEPTVGEEVNDVLQIMLPWMIAVLVHLGVVVLALFIAWSVMTDEREDIIPVARLSQAPASALAIAESIELQSMENARTVQSEQVTSESTLENLNIEVELDIPLVGVTGGANMAPMGVTANTDGLGATMFGATGGNAYKILSSEKGHDYYGAPTGRVSYEIWTCEIPFPINSSTRASSITFMTTNNVMKKMIKSQSTDR